MVEKIDTDLYAPVLPKTRIRGENNSGLQKKTFDKPVQRNLDTEKEKPPSPPPKPGASGKKEKSDAVHPEGESRKRIDILV